MNDQKTLIALLAERSAKRGDFVLASGRKSNLYIDARLTAMSPEGQLIIGREGLAAISAFDPEVDAVGGLTLGADPISYAIAHASALAAELGRSKLVRSFTVRKEVKQYGTGKLIEGPFRSGDRVVVIEDVITTGGSALTAVDAVKAAGGIVLGVLALVDRQEGGREALEGAGLKVSSLANAADIMALLN
ncbi:MAG: orotate phosphoribosyltransferase [Gemmatimonadaceae bacterium]